MKRLLRATLLPVVLLASDADAIDCSQAITTPDLNECASIEKDKVEARLNETYKQVLASLDQSDPLFKDDAARAKAKLIEAQRAWIRYREADCDARYSLNASGTIRTVIWFGCMRSDAEQRIKELTSFMDGD